jgi:hypothetical protein
MIFIEADCIVRKEEYNKSKVCELDSELMNVI